MREAGEVLFDEVLRSLAEDRPLPETLGLVAAFIGQEPVASPAMLVDTATGALTSFHGPPAADPARPAGGDPAPADARNIEVEPPPLPSGTAGPWDEVAETGHDLALGTLAGLPPELRREAEERGLGALWLQAVPVPGESRPAGVVAIWRRSAEPPTEEELVQLRRAVSISSAALGRRLTEQRLSRAALVDPLTGLANRRMLDTLALARPTGELVAVLYLDLDGFKAVNDSYGHDAGDRALAALARRLVGAVRPFDHVLRLGGDEFLVVCGSLAGQEEAVAIAERVIALVANPVEALAGTTELSACVGLATGRSGAVPLDELITLADKALYAAKVSGPGRWSLVEAPV